MSGMVKPRTYGRMGNFLFQAAAAMGYAWRHGMEFTLPHTTNDVRHNPIYLQHLVRKDYNPGLGVITLRESSHSYTELSFEERWRTSNIILDGYWQTEKYFKEFRSQILDAFGYPWKLNVGYVSVHVRRGDYLQLTKKHPPVPREWIENAMAMFPGYQFLFFSDDLTWCRQTFQHRGDVEFHQGEDEVEDLVGMTQCEHHICSASTFSWWGAWLNRNPEKRVIIPKDWFVPGYRGMDTRDIVPPEWTKV